MTQFKQVYFWSDLSKHFHSAEYMNYIFELSNFYKIQCYVNFFTEYHSKNNVNGYFGILSY